MGEKGTRTRRRTRRTGTADDACRCCFPHHHSNPRDATKTSSCPCPCAGASCVHPVHRAHGPYLCLCPCSCSGSCPSSCHLYRGPFPCRGRPPIVAACCCCCCCRRLLLYVVCGGCGVRKGRARASIIINPPPTPHPGLATFEENESGCAAWQRWGGTFRTACLSCGCGGGVAVVRGGGEIRRTCMHDEEQASRRCFFAPTPQNVAGQFTYSLHFHVPSTHQRYRHSSPPCTPCPRSANGRATVEKCAQP